MNEAGTTTNHRTVSTIRIASALSSPESSQRRRCPCCMATVENWRPVIYGPVGPEVVAQARRGEVTLGGMNHGRNEPRWHCIRCRTRFGRPREDLDRFGRAIATMKTMSVKPTSTPAWRTMPTMRIRAITQTAA